MGSASTSRNTRPGECGWIAKRELPSENEVPNSWAVTAPALMTSQATTLLQAAAG